ncbi:hypothetical protein HK103_003401 [Boothiomyces macroporosus]|uniref:Uncharacterized protein n=1 Tax=Boothiomyces macroporosus TaxID=261099 RepID=A0AAD5Y4H5_9FUNG|nr:hypothetical protein HK103_003401 [Boothiomyces macroporosus]
MIYVLIDKISRKVPLQEPNTIAYAILRLAVSVAYFMFKQVKKVVGICGEMLPGSKPLRAGRSRQTRGSYQHITLEPSQSNRSGMVNRPGISEAEPQRFPGKARTTPKGNSLVTADPYDGLALSLPKQAGYVYQSFALLGEFHFKVDFHFELETPTGSAFLGLANQRYSTMHGVDSKMQLSYGLDQGQGMVGGNSEGKKKFTLVSQSYVFSSVLNPGGFLSLDSGSFLTPVTPKQAILAQDIEVVQPLPVEEACVIDSVLQSATSAESNSGAIDLVCNNLDVNHGSSDWLHENTIVPLCKEDPIPPAVSHTETLSKDASLKMEKKPASRKNYTNRAFSKAIADSVRTTSTPTKTTTASRPNTQLPTTQEGKRPLIVRAKMFC